MAICKDCIHNFVCKYGENRANGGYCTGEKCKQYHSADVVPKSKEGAECPTCYGTGRIGTTDWLTKNISKKQLAEEKARAIAEHEQYIKSEVAREIFAEIEAEIKEALNSNYRARPHIAESEELYHIVEGKISALSGMEDFIAELKKKYIPTDEKEGCTTCKHMLSCEPSLTGACELYEKEERQNN